MEAATALVHLLEGDVVAAQQVGWFHPSELSHLCSFEMVAFPGLVGVPPHLRAKAALEWPGMDADSLRSFWHVPSSPLPEYSCPLVLDVEGLGWIMGHSAAVPEHWVDLAGWLEDSFRLPSTAPDKSLILESMAEVSPLGEVVSYLLLARTPPPSLEVIVRLVASSPEVLEVFTCLCLEARGFSPTDLHHFNRILFSYFSHRELVRLAELATFTVSGV